MKGLDVGARGTVYGEHMGTWKLEIPRTPVCTPGHTCTCTYTIISNSPYSHGYTCTSRVNWASTHNNTEIRESCTSMDLTKCCTSINSCYRRAQIMIIENMN